MTAILSMNRAKDNIAQGKPNLDLASIKSGYAKKSSNAARTIAADKMFF